MDKINQQAQKLWRSFLAFTPGQKAVTIAAILALTVGGYLFSNWAGQSSYSPLFTNLAASDASAIVDKLNTSKTPYKLAAGGTEILVPQQDVYQLRLTMSSAGLPTAGTSGYSLLDKEGITTSQFKQQVDFQRAEEGELDRTIQSISGVTAAAVHLAIPQDTVFNDGTQKTTASVLLTLIPGTNLANGQVQSVVNLVSSSVPELSANNVSVSDSLGNVLYSGTDGGAANMANVQSGQTQAIDAQYASAIQSLLDPIAGPGNAKVTVLANLNWDSSTIQANNVTPLKGALSVHAYSSESYGGSASATKGVLGATVTSPAAGVTTGPGGGAYVSAAGTDVQAFNTVSTSTSTAPGSIKNLAIAVVVDSSAAPIPQAVLQNLVSQAVGYNPKRGDTLAVTKVAFNQSAANAASKAASVAAAAAAKAQKSKALMSMVKTGLIVLAVIIVVIMAWLASRKRKKPEEPDDLDLFLAQLNDRPETLPPAPADIIGPKTDLAQSAAHHQRQISEMADEDPDEVARLLRSWLNSKDA